VLLHILTVLTPPPVTARYSSAAATTYDIIALYSEGVCSLTSCRSRSLSRSLSRRGVVRISKTILEERRNSPNNNDNVVVIMSEYSSKN
jgi:hypothetical protein